MRGSRGMEVKVVDKGNDTLTESCEGAVNFMVIEMGDGSWPKLSPLTVVEGLTEKGKVL